VADHARDPELEFKKKRKRKKERKRERKEKFQLYKVPSSPFTLDDFKFLSKEFIPEKLKT
jgi:hypothetical protein